ncbi:hypothetical protein [Zoogloea sp.]|uniref:hypothetical protein n=1 Tax=Zoogloea sp. TaxID=49181 RepID=UPI0025ECF361|nr:hypothetical protein [Zoogloea sp.]MCK6395218.1 hypothetical protein [Zoogloea sp.]
MSPLWPETRRLFVGPERLSLDAPDGPGVALDLHGGWEAAFAAMPALPRRTRLQLQVADRHVRYVHLAWPAGLRRTEREAFAGQRFAAVFGPGPWAVQIDREALCLPSLGAALPAGLQGAIKAFARERGMKVTGLAPAFAAAFNALRPRLAGDGALARLEAGRVTLGLWRAGQWCAVRSLPVAQADTAAAVAGLLPLLAARPAGETWVQPVLHLTGGAAGPAGLALPEGWRLQHLEDAA